MSHRNYKVERTRLKMDYHHKSIRFGQTSLTTHLKSSTLFIVFILVNCFITSTQAKGCSTIWKDGKETAKCDGQGLISVPSGLSSSILVIRLENNNFQILPYKVFQERGLVNLQKIFLSNCTLGMIAQDAFHQLNHLVELDLSQNLLTSVPSESFRNLLNVRRLLLRQNPIKNLREGSFSSLIKLEHLDLSHCQIDSIEPGSFRGIQYLKSLKLNNNRLTTLASNVFVDIPPLYTIALENNAWNCDCELRPLHRWISDNNMLLEPPLCKTPAKHDGKAWSKMYLDALACTPVLLPSETENSGQTGSNATFRCRIKSSPKPEIDWRVQEPNDLVIPSNVQSTASNQQLQHSPPYTLNAPSTNLYLNNAVNSIEERYIISEPIIELDDVVVSTFTLINLQLEDAQRKFVCNAKNSAGVGQETFTINVYSASTSVLKNGSISWTLLVVLLLIVLISLAGMFLFARNRKESKSNANTANGGLSENKLDVLKNVKNSLVGNHHIKKNATSTMNNNLDNNNKSLTVKNGGDQDLPNSHKLKINDSLTTVNGGLYVNGYSTGNGLKSDLMMNGNQGKITLNPNLQYNQSNALSPYSANLNSSGLTLLTNDMQMSGNDLMNNPTELLNYGGPHDFTNSSVLTNQLASSQYGSSFVQSPVNHLLSYQTSATGSTNYLEPNPCYLASSEQLLNGYSNYENMYGPLNQQYLIQQNAYGTYGTTTTANELHQMQTTVNPGTGLNEHNTAAAAAAVYYQNTLGKRNSPMISNNISQNTLAMAGNAMIASQDMSSIYHPQLSTANLQQPNLTHVNILGQGSYNIGQPTVVRYSPDDEGYSEETANSNFTLEGLCASLRILNLNVPSAVRNGSAIYLYCDFELAQNEEVYSVKWYLDNVEFYRYQPSNEPYSGKFFRLKGIHVDLHGSNATHVLLYRMELASEGLYSCEVSTDQFITAIAYKQMKVIALPHEKLRIEGSEFEYDVGHLINLTCICPPTKPQAQLAWFINGKRAPSNLLVKHQSNSIDPANQIEGAKLGLLFQTRRSDFLNGQLWLKCVASLVLSYRFETSQSLDNLRTGSEHRTVTGSHKLASSASSSDLHLRQKETPVIRGLRTSYRVGDLLNLNCSTAARDAQLKWFVNDEPINSNYLISYTSVYQSNQSASNQMASAYESLPHQLNNVYYNNGLVAHALKRRTFSIHSNTYTTPVADNMQRSGSSGARRSIASTNKNNSNNQNSHSTTAYAHLTHQLNNLANLNALTTVNQANENQVLGLQMPLLQQHFQVDIKLKCVVTIHKQVAQLELSLKIITENHDLARMSQSSIANSIIHCNQQSMHLLLFIAIIMVNLMIDR